MLEMLNILLNAEEDIVSALMWGFWQVTQFASEYILCLRATSNMPIPVRAYPLISTV